MIRKLDRLNDTTLALVLALLGVVGLVIGFNTTAHPFHISPALDGVLAACQLGFVLALLHGLPYRRVLLTMSPVLGILVIAAQRQHESVAALVGVNLLVFGVVGLGVAMLLEPRAKVAG